MGLNNVHHGFVDPHVAIKINSLRHVFKLIDDFHILVGTHRIEVNYILGPCPSRGALVSGVG